ncbi:MAG TPA: FAD-binding oxidoreductase [Actinomycetota bacterium]|nr:FAD-binding oxidoreductase [Actinomycetota bacterium]
MTKPEKNYRSYSMWLDQVDDDLAPRPPLGENLDVDVAIVGAGYTGLWTAYYLLKADPGLRVALVEREIAGFGASGRNGGWCSALFAAPASKIAKRYGREAAIAMQREMFDTVDEVGRVGIEENFDFDFHKGGTLTVATSPTHVTRIKEELQDEREWGFGEEDFRWLEADEVLGRVGMEQCHGARYTPHCARVHPAKLVRGLARVVERLGATIYEGTAATELATRRVTTPGGTVTADVVVRGTEAYTAQLPKNKRRLMPLYSLMIGTEPLPQSAWDDIGWSNAETIHDGRHLLIYAQRTVDGRIAIGGRGAPYHFGSTISDENDREPRMFEAIRDVLGELFPATRDAEITHRWGGPIGVPRDWFTSVGHDPTSGLAWAGGYAGDGVSTTNLAGRTLRDLVLKRDTALTKLPWVNHRSRSWEPEPARWIGVNLALKAMAYADDLEERTGRPTRRGRVIKSLIGL